MSFCDSIQNTLFTLLNWFSRHLFHKSDEQVQSNHWSGKIDRPLTLESDGAIDNFMFQ